MLLGAIDIGTNSIHLIVVELDPRFGTSRTVLKEREMVRLGAGDGLQRGMLGKKTMLRGVEAIARFAVTSRLAGAREIRAVATSAVREAANRDEFRAMVEAACGVIVEVLPDIEEARLIHLGVSRGFPLQDRVGCIMDIGGGSTEFIVGDAMRPFSLHSVKLGSLRLYEEFLADADGVKAYRAMRRRIRERFEPVREQLAAQRFDVMIGTSGTVLGLAALDAAARAVPVQRTHGYVLRRERLVALQKEMLRMTPAERRKMPGMNPRRSDIIVAGNAVVIEAMELLGREELSVCERALRDGIVVDYLERDVALTRKLGDVRARRFESVQDLAKRFGSDGIHEHHVGMLAIELFDRLRDLHDFEAADRDALFAAALLHDVGRVVNISEHHKHGAYIVRHAGIPGWRDEEVALIAALVRYHRRALPKPTHTEWMQADQRTRRKIEGLGAMLRLADGLDARHLGLVNGIEIARVGEEIEVCALARQEVEPEIEAARRKSDLFARAFGKAPRVSGAAQEVAS